MSAKSPETWHFQGFTYLEEVRLAPSWVGGGGEGLGTRKRLPRGRLEVEWWQQEATKQILAHDGSWWDL